ncbi:hypothetical protein [Microbacterium murale]|uniref:Uncharacterized protein n=1 Tax=Microbacterium murale TaxID=1081040 RepID=A0ABU0PDY5_9MICO|nr:hypothetical protein [Microbacterium murale]MDQ0645533.1 hypothetical protein [Microbacterium murale]
MVDRSKKPSLWDAMRFGVNGTTRADLLPVIAPAPQRDPADVAEPETVDRDDIIDSPYAPMSQRERLHLIETRPTLAPWAEKPISTADGLTEMGSHRATRRRRDPPT